MYCNQCGSEVLILMGTLGNLEHYRCRDCGWEQSTEVTDDDMENQTPSDLDETNWDVDTLPWRLDNVPCPNYGEES